MKKSVQLLMVMVISMGAAAAERWIPVATNMVGGVVSIDAQTYRKGVFHEFWSWTDKVECYSGETPPSCSDRAKFKVNCKTNEYAILRQMRFGPNGNIVEDRSATRAKFGEPIPDSIGEAIVQFVCHK